MCPHSSTALLYQGLSGLAPALTSLASLAGKGQLSTWLYRIAINVALRQLFSQRRRILHSTRQALRMVFRLRLASAAKSHCVFVKDDGADASETSTCSLAMPGATRTNAYPKAPV